MSLLHNSKGVGKLMSVETSSERTNGRADDDKQRRERKIRGTHSQKKSSKRSGEEEQTNGGSAARDSRHFDLGVVEARACVHRQSANTRPL